MKKLTLLSTCCSNKFLIISGHEMDFSFLCFPDQSQFFHPKSITHSTYYYFSFSNVSGSSVHSQRILLYKDDNHFIIDIHQLCGIKYANEWIYSFCKGGCKTMGWVKHDFAIRELILPYQENLWIEKSKYKGWQIKIISCCKYLRGLMMP